MERDESDREAARERLFEFIRDVQEANAHVPAEVLEAEVAQAVREAREIMARERAEQDGSARGEDGTGSTEGPDS